VTRVPSVTKNIEIGLELLALRSAVRHNASFGRQVWRQFEIDGQHAGELLRVARSFGDRPEIYTCLSWRALLMLSSPTMPRTVRQDIEARILSGQVIRNRDIRRVSGQIKTVPPEQADQPARRMAA
jgi:hypothetical protein